MSTFLAPFINATEHADPSAYQTFFTKNENESIKNDYVYPRECTESTFPPPCDANLFFGFFFDGTNNNLKRDRNSRSQSNVANLYSAFPGDRDDYDSEAWDNLEKKYQGKFFRTYIPGVGTPFKLVDDTGTGFNIRHDDRARGLAFCHKGQNRIIWALVQALNNIHRYFTGHLLIDEKIFKDRFNKLTLPSYAASPVDTDGSDDNLDVRSRDMKKLKAAFSDALKQLHEALRSFLPVGPGQKLDKGKVMNIYVSMFGFSRGATKARVFANWLIWLCRLDAKLTGQSGLSLCTIPVTLDFLGLFDTVASVGVASSFPFADGHQGWADADASLKIPGEISSCLHLISAHEVRRSFPLDSVLHRGVLPANCTEIVFPGVHSDIGGGYAPGEQGHGADPEGSDLFSRIPLAVMYREARLNGAPLKLESAPEVVKRSFRVDPGMIHSYNAYITDCRKAHQVASGQSLNGLLHLIMEEQHKFYILWRKKILATIEQLSSVRASNPHDQADIIQANKEFKNEISYFENWRRNQMGDVERTPSAPEWSAIDKYWDEPTLSHEVCDFFAGFVHDSRASFKPLGKDMAELQFQMESLAIRSEEIHLSRDRFHSPEKPSGDLTAKEIEQVERYQAYKSSHPKTIDYSAAIDPQPEGREPSILGGGLLRFRKIYMGSDSFKPFGARYAGLAPTPETEEIRTASAPHQNEEAFLSSSERLRRHERPASAAPSVSRSGTWPSRRLS